MAKAKLNSMFTCISGRMGNIVFYKRMGTQCLRRYVIPRNPDTEAQRINRHTFRDAVISWRELPLDEKNIYNRKVLRIKKAMSGYNFYISEYMKKNTVNDTLSEAVQVQERFTHNSVPLRSAYSSTPFMPDDREYIACTVPLFGPG